MKGDVKGWGDDDDDDKGGGSRLVTSLLYIVEGSLSLIHYDRAFYPSKISLSLW